MVTSGTYNFAPSMGELVLYAYGLCGVRSAALTQQHMEDARMASNLLLGRWSSQGVNTWQVDLQTVPLTAGVGTYSVPSNTIVMLDAYITQGGINRLILPVSRSEYASYPNPSQVGAVTVFWMDRLLSPTVTLYYVPDATQTTLSYYRLRQTMDSAFTDGQNVEVPYYWLEAFAHGLAQRLAVIWAPERAMGLKQLADESYLIAASQDVEVANVYVQPMMSGYWRT